jgi:Na+/melibiose symporter-like transporter
MSGSTLLAIPLWAYLAIRLGKKNTWMLSMTFLFIGFFIFYIYPIAELKELLYILSFIGFW